MQKSGDTFVELVLCARGLQRSGSGCQACATTTFASRAISLALSNALHFLCQLRTVTVHSPLRGCGKEIYLLPQRPWSGGLTTITWSSEKCHVSHKSQLQWHRTQDASWDSPSSQNRLLLSQREEVDGDLCLNMDMPRKPAHH